ncbi:MAG: M36 family metallopeptidase [Nitrospirae bacterium]|nr:M36 family metallopeptidase [Nitrospirota bacterium]
MDNSGIFALTPADLPDFKLIRKYTTEHNGITHISLKQHYQGIPVIEGEIRGNVDSEGRILNIGGDYYPGINIGTVPPISAVDAIRTAAADAAPGVAFEPVALSGPTGPPQETVFQKGAFNTTDAYHSAGLVIFPMQGQFRLAWQVIFHKNSNERYIILVDSETGKVLYRTNMVKFNSPYGLVFAEDPDDAGQVTKSFTGDLTASPLGWLNKDGGVYHTLGGNNVCAQEDRDNMDNGGYSPSRPQGNFNYTFTNAYFNSGGTDLNTDINATITNLFYMRLLQKSP